MKPVLRIEAQRWPVHGAFRIARGSRTHVDVIHLQYHDDPLIAQAECVPYARYRESVDSVMQQIQTLTADVERGISRAELQHKLKAGAARNALDCLLWDLEAKHSDTTVAALCQLEPLKALQTTFTLGIDTPELMAKAAQKAKQHRWIKVKLGQDMADADRLLAVREAAPDAELIVDANEGWTPQDLENHLRYCVEARVAWIEQPLHAQRDHELTHSRPSEIVFCADESAHVSADCERLCDRYQAVNIKLDKTGGLSEARLMLTQARRLGLKVMVGCMLGTSLAMAPALVVAQAADITDLDGPLLLQDDRKPALRYHDGWVFPPERSLWG